VRFIMSAVKNEQYWVQPNKKNPILCYLILK
jgi:hypothetical protein